MHSEKKMLYCIQINYHTESPSEAAATIKFEMPMPSSGQENQMHERVIGRKWQ